MDTKTKGKIINALRKLTYSYLPRNSTKNTQKVAPATFECELCQIWIYEGSKKLEKLDLKPPKELIKGKIYLDHKDPVIPLKSFQRGSWDWDEFINRLFCDQEGFQAICADCHKEKTDLENQERKKYRKAKKSVDKKK